VTLTFFQVVVLSLLQGVAELFPVSSLGHTVIAPALLGWNIDQKSDAFLPFVTTLHLGTGIALVVYFWQDWVRIVTPMVGSVRRGQLSGDPEERLGWLLVAGTIPAAIVGVFFEKSIKNLFANPKVAAGFLIANGFILFFGERLRLRAQSGAPGGGATLSADPPEGDRAAVSLRWGEAVAVGAAQALALLPGISRSGVTMVAGLGVGLSHETAARYTFLLATPIILAAALVEVPTLFDPANSSLLGDAIFGGILSGVAAFVSVRFLMRYFATNRLTPFAYYCWAAGTVALLVLTLRG